MDFPSLGLNFDLTEVVEGIRTLDRAEDATLRFGEAVERTADKVERASKRMVNATQASAREASRPAGRSAKTVEELQLEAATRALGQRMTFQRRMSAQRMAEERREAATVESTFTRSMAFRTRMGNQQVAEATAAARESAQAQIRADRDAQAQAAQTLAFRSRMTQQRAREEISAEQAVARARDQAATEAARAEARSAAEQQRTAQQVTAFKMRMSRQRVAEETAAARETARASAEAAAADQRALQQTMAFRMRMARQRAAEEAAQARADAAASRRRASNGSGAPPTAAAGAGGGILSSIGQFLGIMPSAERDVGSLTSRIGGLNDGVGKLRNTFLNARFVIAAFLGAMAVGPIVQMADAMTALDARIGIYAKRQSDVPATFEALYQAAQTARQPLEAMGVLYTRLAPMATQLGKSQLDLIGITETIAKSFAISGTSAAEAASSTQQLAQALASNRLGGDELRSLAENAPVLLNEVAKALGMNVGQFIKWAQAGNANAAVVIGAVEKAKTRIDEMFGAMPVTIGQSITVVTNAMTHLVDRVNQMTGTTEKVAGFIASFQGFLEAESTANGIAKAIDVTTKSFQIMGTVIETVVDLLPALAAGFGTLVAIQAAATAMAAFNRTMVTMQLLAAISGKSLFTLAGAQAVVTAGARGMIAALGGVAGILSGGVAIAIFAAVAAWRSMKDAQAAVARSAEMLKDAQEGAIGAVQRAISFSETYGRSTDALDKQLQAMGNSSTVAATATDATSAAHARAQQQALNRANAERVLTQAILTRAAAEAGKAADEAEKALNGRGWLLGADGLRAQSRRADTRERSVLQYGNTGIGGNYQDPEATARARAQAGQARERVRAARTTVEQSRQLQAQMTTLAQDMGKPLEVGDITIPNIAGPAQPGPAKEDKGGKGGKGMNGALNTIARMRAELAGLKEEAESISADPLSALAAQIKRVGDEAAASLENGKASGLQETARKVAADLERQRITNRMLQDSADAESASAREAKATEIATDAQVRSNNIMRAFWSSGTRDAAGYAAALQASRDAITEAQVQTETLAVAQRYGATSIDQISEALERNGVAYGANAQAIEDAAKREAAAKGGQIRGAATGAAQISAPDDADAFNTTNAEIMLGLMQQIDETAQSMANSLSGSFGQVGDAMAAVISTLSQYRVTQAQIAANFARDVAGIDKNSDRYRQAEKRRDTASRSEKLKMYGDTIAAAKGFFNENSRGYRILEAAEKGFRLYEFAMSAKSIVVKGIETAAKIGMFGAQAAAAAQAGAANMFATLGPAGFAAVAGMVAVLGGLGLALSGGGASGPGNYETAEQRQAKQGTGTVLGARDEQSESLLNAMEIVAEHTNKNLEYSNGMLSALRAIQSNIGALTNVLARQLSLGSGTFSTDSLNLGNTAQGPSLISKILNPIAAILPGLFGSTKSTTLADQGLSFQNQTVSNVMSGGIRGNTYADTLTQTKKKFLGITYSDKTKLNTTTGAIDSETSNQVGLLIRSLRDGAVAAAEVLGIQGAASLIDNMQLNIGKISLKDMTGEQIQEQLNAVFGKVADNMATTIMPAVTQFQKVGEGAFETLTRLARDYQVVDITLQSLGKQFGSVGVASIAARERLIELSGGLDQFTDQAAFFAENFLTDQERLAPVQKALSTELARLGLSSITTRDQFKRLVMGLDTSTEGGSKMYAALMNIAPAFAAVTGEAQAMAERLAKIADYVQGLLTSKLSPLAPQEQLAVSENEFNRLLKLAQSGDVNALSQITDASSAYLEQAQKFFASSPQYAAIFDRVYKALDELSGGAGEDPIITVLERDFQRLIDAINAGFHGTSGTGPGTVTTGEPVPPVQVPNVATPPAFTGGAGGGYTPRIDGQPSDRYTSDVIVALDAGFASVNQQLAGVAEAVVESNDAGYSKLTDTMDNTVSTGSALRGGVIRKQAV